MNERSLTSPLFFSRPNQEGFEVPNVEENGDEQDLLDGAPPAELGHLPPDEEETF
jgi:hypothetical protein